MSMTQKIKKALVEALPSATWSVRKTRKNEWVGQVYEATYKQGQLTDEEIYTANWIVSMLQDTTCQIEVHEIEGVNK